VVRLALAEPILAEYVEGDEIVFGTTTVIDYDSSSFYNP
jgi:hypothetical protein